MRKVFYRQPDNRITCPDCKIRIDVRSLPSPKLRCPWCGEALMVVFGNHLQSLCLPE